MKNNKQKSLSDFVSDICYHFTDQLINTKQNNQQQLIDNKNISNSYKYKIDYLIQQNNEYIKKLKKGGCNKLKDKISQISNENIILFKLISDDIDVYENIIKITDNLDYLFIKELKNE